MVQSAIKIAEELPKFTAGQKTIRYLANSLERLVLNQIQLYIDQKTEDLKLESLKKLLDLL